MTILIVGGICTVAVIALAVTWALLPHGDHHASRPARRGPASWACEQRARAGKAVRSWWAWHRPRRDLSPDDQTTIAVIAEMHHEDTGGFLTVPLAGDEPGPESEPSGAPVPAPAELPATVTAQLAPLAALVDELRQADDTASFERIAAGWGR